MAGEKKTEGSSTEEKGIAPAEASKLVPSGKAARGVVLICGYADEQLLANFKEIIEKFMGKAKEGDPAALKLIMELAGKAGRAEEISEEEVETLGMLLLREFHGTQDAGKDAGTGVGQEAVQEAVENAEAA